MPQEPANFQFIENRPTFGVNERRLVGSHVAALRYGSPPPVPSDSLASTKTNRKRRRRVTVHKLQLRHPDSLAHQVCGDGDAVLRVNTVDPLETLSIPYESYLDPILCHC